MNTEEQKDFDKAALTLKWKLMKMGYEERKAFDDEYYSNDHHYFAASKHGCFVGATRAEACTALRNAGEPIYGGRAMAWVVPGKLEEANYPANYRSPNVRGELSVGCDW